MAVIPQYLTFTTSKVKIKLLSYFFPNPMTGKVYMQRELSYFDVYTLYKARRKSESSFSHSFLATFLSIVMQQISSFILWTGLLFFKNLFKLLVFFNRVPYIQISDMIPGVNIIGRKMSTANINRAKGSGSTLEPSSDFQGQSTLRKFCFMFTCQNLFFSEIV